MKQVFTWLLALSFLLLHTGVNAQSPSREDIAYFKEETYSRFGNETLSSERPRDIEHLLLWIVNRENDPADIISAYAESLGISEDEAEDYISLIITSLRLRNQSNDPGTAPGAALSGGQPDFDRLAANYTESPGPQLINAIGENLSGTPYMDQFFNSIRAYPEYEPVLVSLFLYTRKARYLLAAYEYNSARQDFLARRMAFNDWISDLGVGYRLGLALHLFHKAQNSPENQAEARAMSALILFIMMDEGLEAEAIEFFDKSDVGGQAYLLDFHNQDAGLRPVGVFPALRRIIESPYELSLNLAAVFIRAGRTNEAEAILEDLRLNHRKHMPSIYLNQLWFLGEYRTQTVEPSALYTIFNDGLSDDFYEIPGRNTDDEDFWPTDVGYSLSLSMPAMRLLEHDFMQSNGYPGMARSALYFNIYPSERDERTERKLLDLLPAEMRDRAVHLQKTLEARRTELKTLAQQPSYEDILHHMADQQKPVIYSEQALPAEFRYSEDEYRRAIADIPDGLSLPVETDQVAAIQKNEGLWTLVFHSTVLDPTGEVSAGGYWVTESQNGETWTDPLYLGLQIYFPYKVRPNQKLPLRQGNTLRIEVRINEIEKASLGFPPVLIDSKREEEDLYLQFSLSDIRRDRDGDGLTDIAEHRMGLDMNDHDTDGDGLPDGVDPLPLVPVDRQNALPPEISIAIMEGMRNFQAGAIITGGPSTGNGEDPLLNGLAGLGSVQSERIAPSDSLPLIADPHLFSGLISSDTRLLIYTEKQVRDLADSYGVFYPPQITNVIMNHEKTEVQVSWDAQWAIGGFVIQKTERGYEIVSSGMIPS